MADLAPLAAEFGTEAGALAPSGAVPTDGARVLVLGADQAGRRRDLVAGDYLEAAQDVAAGPGEALLRAEVLVRGTAPPAGARWLLALTVGGEERWAVELPAAGHRALPDSAALLTPGSSTEVGFRLRLDGPDGTEYTAAELPAVYVDAITVESPDATAPILVNRVPSPGETGVPIGSTVVLEFADAGTTGVDVGETFVEIADSLAFDGGSFVAPWNGPGSSYEVLDGGRALRIVIDPTADFEGEQLVPVVVRSRLTATPGSELEETYSFTTEDVTAPRLLSAVAVSHRRVIAVFSEPMGAASVTAATWTVSFAGTSLDTGLPAYPAQVARASLLAAGNQAELELDADLTPGGAYRLTVAGARDEAGNAVDAPDNTADFAGFACAPARRRFDLYRMMPEYNRVQDRDRARDLEKLCRCLQDTLDLVLCAIDRWVDIIDPVLAPEAFVDAMLADLGNPFRVALDLVGKRRLAESLVAIYKRKGPGAGIVEVVRLLLGLDVEINVPAFDGGWILGESRLSVDTDLGTTDRALRYSFRVLSPVALTEEQVAEIAAIADYMRPAHTHLLGVYGPVAAEETDRWTLNVSRLSVDTNLDGA